MRFIERKAILSTKNPEIKIATTVAMGHRLRAFES